jgi:hypothetical protein
MTSSFNTPVLQFPLLRSLTNYIFTYFNHEILLPECLINMKIIGNCFCFPLSSSICRLHVQPFCTALEELQALKLSIRLPRVVYWVPVAEEATVGLLRVMPLLPQLRLRFHGRSIVQVASVLATVPDLRLGGYIARISQGKYIYGTNT